MKDAPDIPDVTEKHISVPNEDSSISHRLDNAVLVAIVSIVLTLLTVILYFALVTTSYGRPVDSAGFGDTFGGLNAAFSGFAFIALVSALLMQSKELSLQREELQETQRLMVEQKGEMVRQAETMHLQQFESTFFQLLNQQRKILELVSVQGLGRSPNIRGLEAVQVLEQVLNGIALTPHRAMRYPQGNRELQVEFVRLNSIFQSIESGFAHYFRHLYRIIKFVDSAKVTDKAFYIGIVTAQLSSAEISVLLFNALSTAGAKFKPLIEKYCILQHVRWRGTNSAWICFYHKNAFFSHKFTRSELNLLVSRDFFVEEQDREALLSWWDDFAARSDCTDIVKK